MSRDRILNSIIANKPGIINLPIRMEGPENKHGDLTGEFIDSAISAGADVVELDSIEEVEEWMRQQDSQDKVVFDLMRKPDERAEQILSSHDFNNLDIVVIRGQMGVAENGAVWIDDKDMRIRKLPFVTGHLVFVLAKKNILADMHQAYTRIDLSHTDFGVFIAGPSKTADIEQSLVIGAHGPVRHTILLLTQSE